LEGIIFLAQTNIPSRNEHRIYLICPIIKATAKELKDGYRGRLKIPVAIGPKFTEVQEYRHFVYRKLLLFWSDDLKRFSSFEELERKITLGDIYFHQTKWRSGLTNKEVENRRTVYGENRIAVELTPLLKLLFFEVLSPFYIFQALR
jgi:hypothetical protein